MPHRNVSAAFSVAIALVCSLPAFAQTQTVPFHPPPVATGTLTTTGDVVPIDVAGGRWATVVWRVTGTAGTAGITTEVSIDNGTNWIPSAYSKRLDTVAASPSVVQWVSNSGITGSVWETPLPGNSTQFRLRCGATGTTTSVQVSVSAPYVPGVPVVATLYDAVEAGVGTGITAVVQDTSGWNSVMVTAASPTGQVFTVAPLDDAGAVMLGATRSFTAAAGGIAVFTRYGGDSTSSTVGSTAVALYPSLSRRMTWALPAGGTVTAGRIRVEASR